MVMVVVKSTGLPVTSGRTEMYLLGHTAGLFIQPMAEAVHHALHHHLA